MLGDIHFTKMPERLRQQQRALRMPRRARPFDPRTTIDRRVQQEARRMGVSPMALYQQRDFLQKQAKDFTEQLKKAQVPAQIQASIQNIPREVSQYMNIQAILEKVTQQYNKQFDSKISQLNTQLGNIEQRMGRIKGISPGLERQHADLRHTITTLQSHKREGNVLFSDALTHAKEVGRAQGIRAADQASYQRRMDTYYEQLAAQKTPAPTVTVQEIAPTDLWGRSPTIDFTKPITREQMIQRLPEPKPFDFLKSMLGIR